MATSLSGALARKAQTEGDRAMKPIFLILYAAIVTLVLTLVFPRFRQATPNDRRIAWVGLLLGGVGLLVVTALALTS